MLLQKIKKKRRIQGLKDRVQRELYDSLFECFDFWKISVHEIKKVEVEFGTICFEYRGQKYSFGLKNIK